MSVIQSDLLLGQEGGAGYQISRSLRFNSADSAYLSRTPSVAGNRKTWTWAGWVKRSVVDGGFYYLFDALSSTSSENYIRFGDSTNANLAVWSDVTGTGIKTTQVFRDASAWYHIVVAWDTTQATAANRTRLYVNGAEITTFDSATYPTQNADGGVNNNTAHSIGRYQAGAARHFNGYLADIHFIDGQALTPSSFGQFDANGIWQPKAYTGTYGTNGFKLNFSDNSTAAALGTDTSGNGNTWTVNNLSVTAGAGNDSVVDSPVNGSQVDTGAGGEVRGNYATFNPLASAGTFSNGNLQVATSGSGESSGLSSIGLPTSGKWYWEVTIDTLGLDAYTGITDGSSATSLGSNWVAYRGNGQFASTPTVTNPPNAASYTTGDIIGLAFNADSLTLAFYKNGSLQGTTSGIIARQYFTLCYCYTTAQRTINFGQRPFAYTAPSGFKALCTANLPTPTGVVAQPSTAMDVKLYTGNGSTQTISGLGFSPDFVWIKDRGAANFHVLVDAVRGTGSNGSLLELYSNATNAEGNIANRVTGLTSTGFTLGSDANQGVNNSGASLAAWCWDAGSSTVTNTQGSITSSVRANASAGFSIVTWTGNSTANATIGHGLGVTPQFVITKRRDSTSYWLVYHVATGKDQYLWLNDTSAAGTLAGYWGTTGPTSTTVQLSQYQNNNGSMVAYCFAPVAGYSSFGSYTGNGSADGPFVYTGFRPRWVMIKATSGATQWFMYDAARSPNNISDLTLLANSSAGGNAYEGMSISLPIDILSNGFKLRYADVGGYTNYSTWGYIYAAFAESPFQYARAR